MTDQIKLRALTEALDEFEPIGPSDGVRSTWRFDGADPMTGCLAYRSPELGLTTYCTPGYDRSSDRDDAIVVSTVTDEGDVLGEDYAIPFVFEKTPAQTAASFRLAMARALRVIEGAL